MYDAFSNPFSGIDFSNIEVGSGSSLLKAGRHTVKTVDAKLEDKGGRKQLVVRFELPDGSAAINGYFNMWADNPKAREINRELVKALCVHGGHPKPDNPFPAGVASLVHMVGLTVGVRVDERTYTKDGEEKTTVEVRGFFNPNPMRAEVPAGVAAARPLETLDDEIPF